MTTETARQTEGSRQEKVRSTADQAVAMLTGSRVYKLETLLIGAPSVWPRESHVTLLGCVRVVTDHCAICRLLRSNATQKL